MHRAGIILNKIYIDFQKPLCYNREVCSQNRSENGNKFRKTGIARRINVPGFRRGKAPRKLIEKMYGADVFYEGAANEVIPEEYSKAAEESKLDIVSRPKISATQLEVGKPFIFTAEVAVRPEVELGQYKGVEVDKQDTEVTDKDIED